MFPAHPSKMRIKNIEFVHKFVWRVCNAICFMAFGAWFMYAANNYLKMSASSSVSLKNGDDGDGFVKFPVISFCKPADVMQGLWKEVTPCSGTVKDLRPPYFLAWMINCLESNSTETVANLVEKVTYTNEDFISDIIFIDPLGSAPLLGGPKSKDFTPISWKTKQDKILSSHYNLHFGHCIQLDISPLSSQKNGKYLMGKGIHFVHMRVNVKTDQNLDQLFPSLFFHNGTDVDRLGENILGRELSSGKHDFKVKKLIVKSLPTRDEKCNQINYQACVINAFNVDIKKNHDCSMAFLTDNGAKSQCSNSVSVTVLKDLATAIEDDQYLDCKNIKPCSSAVYSLVNPSSTMFPPPTKGGKAFPEAAMMIIQFENTMVEVIEDQYDNTFISIFSDIGGSIGVLVGMSCMTIVEGLLMLHKKIDRMIFKS